MTEFLKALPFEWCQYGFMNVALVAVVLSDKSGKPFGPVRIGVDLTFALVGFALGGVVGIGTIICAFLVGPVAQLFFPVSEKICVCVLNQFAGVNSRS